MASINYKKKYTEARVLNKELSKNILSGNICSYCGLFAEEKEHVVPKSWFGRDYDERWHKKHGNIVRSCANCNRLASKTYCDSFWEKKQLIKERIYIKYEGYLSAPTWTDEDFDELDTGWVKDYIKCCSKIQNILHFRIENLNKPEAILKE
jgi:hypothetical protein